jgi:tRNA(fMet)-specific endonuclease VapC
MEDAGKSLTALDMLIATHALASRSILVTADKAFSKVPHLKVEDWTDL